MRRSFLASAAETGVLSMDGERIPYAIVRSQRRKRSIAFAFEPQGSLRILAPVRLKQAAVLDLLSSNASRLAQRLKRLKRLQRAQQPLALPERFEEGASVAVLGNPCAVRLVRSDAWPAGCRLRHRQIHIVLPTLASAERRNAPAVEEEREQGQEIRRQLRRWLRQQAAVVLRARLQAWSQKLGLVPYGFSLTKARTRWGSCSADNIVRLNWRLMMTPLALVDYVVVHELCHIRHKHHGPAFWSAVAQALPDYRERRRRLKQIALTGAF